MRAVVYADDTQAVDDVFIDAFGKWVPFLKDHADPPAQLNDVRRGVVDIFAFELDFAGDPRVEDEVVHAVETAQQGGFAAARRADERRGFFFRDLEVDRFESTLVAVVKVDVLDTDNGFRLFDGFCLRERGLFWCRGHLDS